MNHFFPHIERTRFRLISSLVLSLLLINCTENKTVDNTITIEWNGEKAEAVTIPLSILPTTAKDSIGRQLEVRLMNNTVPIIYDELTVNNEFVLFKPLIAFTNGLKYEVFFSGQKVGAFEIPPASTKDKTEVVSIYPTTDTLPENALKMYIVFSKPMQEGQALNNITVIKNDHDTLSSTFLDLDKELWNRERTILTLWFDPGRVKRDLQPNKNFGAPLQENNRYKIIVNDNWRDERGLTLRSAHQKFFTVGKRDSRSPSPDTWTLQLPKASTKDVLLIELHEPLDYILLRNAVQIIDKNDNVFNGSFGTADNETILTFTPNEIWKPGDYFIKVESRLEDLAGNNLSRLFDEDLARSGSREEKTFFTKKFRVN